MVRLLDITSSRIRMRQPGGRVVFDPNERMPVKSGEVTYSNVVLDFDKPTGADQEGQIVTGGFEYRWVVPAYNSDPTKTLGAFSGASAPDWIMARARFSRTMTGRVDPRPFKTGIVDNAWICWPGGSLLIEAAPRADDNWIWLWRYLSLHVTGGDWVVRLSQGNEAYTTDWRSASYAGPRSKFDMDIVINWGYLV